MTVAIRTLIQHHSKLVQSVSQAMKLVQKYIDALNIDSASDIEIGLIFENVYNGCLGFKPYF